MHLRQATIQEIPLVETFYNIVIDGMQNSPYSPLWEKGIYPDYTYLKKAIENKTLYVYPNKTQPVKQAYIAAVILNSEYNCCYNNVSWNIQENTDKSNILIVHTLGILPNMQHQGMGQKMIHDILKIAQEKHIKSIRLDVLLHNIPAQKLYEKMGFENRGTVDIFIDNVSWKKAILYEYNFEGEYT